MPASRSVVSVLLRELGDFSLHPQGRPCGRPPAAAVLGRQDYPSCSVPDAPSRLLTTKAADACRRTLGAALGACP
jgi:hypothetical protein